MGCYPEASDVPTDWDIHRLSKNWDVIDCKHITAEFVSSGIPIVSIREVQARFVDVTEAKQTTDAFYAQLIEGGREPQPGDLILSRNATVGEVAQVADWHPPFAMGQDVCLLRKRSPGQSSEYLQSVFKSDIIARQLERLMVGSTFRRVNVQQVKALVVPFPPVAEQRAIAEALSDVDGLLGALGALIAKKRAINKAAMQQLLTGKTRLPGFSGEWSRVVLGNHVTFLKTGTNSRADLQNEGPIRYLHYGDIHTSDQVRLQPQVTAMPRLPEEHARKLDHLRNGDLILVDASEDIEGVGKSVEIVGAPGICVVAGLHTIAARFDSSILSDGFKAYLQFCPAFRDKLRRLAAGTKVYATNRAHISSVEILLPGAKEQTAIATVLLDMDAEIAGLQRRWDKIYAIKQGMIQTLLTGEIRLV